MGPRDSGGKGRAGWRRRATGWWGRLDPWRIAAGVFGALIVASLVLAAVGPAAFGGGGQFGEVDGTTAGGMEYEAELRRRVEEQPSDPVAAVALANFLSLKNRGEVEIVDLYERAIGFDPENGRYRRDFAATLVQLGRAADGEVQFRRALAIDDRDAGSRLGLASLLERAQPARADEAIVEYRRLLREEPGSYYSEEAVQGLARLGAANGGGTPVGAA